MKKIFNFLLIILLCSAVSFAQDAKTEGGKTFGGRSQYKTFSIGINGGALAPVVLIGGSNDFKNWDANFGYGVSLKKQLSHIFAFQANVLFGDISGNNDEATGGVVGNYKSFKTKIAYGADLRGVVSLGSVNFLSKTNNLNFSATTGLGLLAYAPSYVNAANTQIDWKGNASGGSDYIKEAYIPLGVNAKFKISDCISFDLGYTMNFVDGDNLDANYAKPGAKDKFSYTSMGLEFALGAKSKTNLIWANPIATMYDELKGNSLNGDVMELKGRVKKVEDAVTDLKKDSDNDGVADRFDKCPNTPTTVKVDGSGCPLNIIK